MNSPCLTCKRLRPAKGESLLEFIRQNVLAKNMKEKAFPKIRKGLARAVWKVMDCGRRIFPALNLHPVSELYLTRARYGNTYISVPKGLFLQN